MELPERQEETTLIDPHNKPLETKKAKKLLGKVAENLSDDELKELVAETRFLVQSWLDDFEKSLFDGKTLQDLLYERNRP